MRKTDRKPAETSSARTLPVGIGEVLGLEVEVRQPGHTPKPQGKKGGGQYKPIDWAHVALLIFSGCPLVEVAPAVNVSIRTLRDRCERDNGYSLSEFRARFDGMGRAALRTAQMLSALKGEPRAQRFLAMNRLGMSEKQDKRHLHAHAVAIYDPGDEAQQLPRGQPVASAIVGLPSNGKEAPRLPRYQDADALALAQLDAEDAEKDGRALEPPA